MGFFSRFFRSRDKPKNYLGGLSFLFGGTTAGQTVNESTSMQVTAVYACVRVLAEAVAGLPVYIYRQNGKGKERVTDHPLYRILHDEPNPDMTSFVFRETMMSHLLLWGNAYAQILRARGGQVQGLFPLLPDKMKVDRDPKTKKLVYTYTKSDDQNPNFKGASQIELKKAMLDAIRTSLKDSILSVTGSDLENALRGIDRKAEELREKYRAEGGALTDESAALIDRNAEAQKAKIMENFERDTVSRINDIWRTGLEQRLAAIDREAEAWRKKGVDEAAATRWAEQAKADAIVNRNRAVMTQEREALNAYLTGGIKGLEAYQMKKDDYIGQLDVQAISFRRRPVFVCIAKKCYNAGMCRGIYAMKTFHCKSANLRMKEENMVSKKLVAFFSASGVTGRVAKDLAEAANADMFEIKPETPYTKADLNWRDENARSTVEMKNKSSRPPLAENGVDISAYDTIFVGFPIWWYVAPTIINTFLEGHDFSGKTIILFATSGGSGFGKTVEGLRGSVSKTATIKEGRILNGHPSAQELKHWVESLGV